MNNYKKHILHGAIMAIKDQKIYLIHKISTWYCRTENVKLFLTNHVLYFHKNGHHKIAIYWRFCLFISLYRHVVYKVGPATPPLFYLIFFQNIVSIKLKLKTEFQVHFLCEQWHSKGKMCKCSFMILYKLAEQRSAIRNVLKHFLEKQK